VAIATKEPEGWLLMNHDYHYLSKVHVLEMRETEMIFGHNLMSRHHLRKLCAEPLQGTANFFQGSERDFQLMQVSWH
jgi:hypothetical protein